MPDISPCPRSGCYGNGGGGEDTVEVDLRQSGSLGRGVDDSVSEVLCRGVAADTVLDVGGPSGRGRDRNGSVDESGEVGMAVSGTDAGRVLSSGDRDIREFRYLDDAQALAGVDGCSAHTDGRSVESSGGGYVGSCDVDDGPPAGILGSLVYASDGRGVRAPEGARDGRIGDGDGPASDGGSAGLSAGRVGESSACQSDDRIPDGYRTAKSSDTVRQLAVSVCGEALHADDADGSGGAGDQSDTASCARGLGSAVTLDSEASGTGDGQTRRGGHCDTVVACTSYEGAVAVHGQGHDASGADAQSRCAGGGDRHVAVDAQLDPVAGDRLHEGSLGDGDRAVRVFDAYVVAAGELRLVGGGDEGYRCLGGTDDQ